MRVWESPEPVEGLAALKPQEPVEMQEQAARAVAIHSLAWQAQRASKARVADS